MKYLHFYVPSSSHLLVSKWRQSKNHRFLFSYCTIFSDEQPPPCPTSSQTTCIPSHKYLTDVTVPLPNFSLVYARLVSANIELKKSLPSAQQPTAAQDHLEDLLSWMENQIMRNQRLQTYSFLQAWWQTPSQLSPSLAKIISPRLA